MGLEQGLGRGWPWRRKGTAQSPGASHMERAAEEGPHDASPIPQGGGLKRAVFPPTPRPRVCLPSVTCRGLHRHHSLPVGLQGPGSGSRVPGSTWLLDPSEHEGLGHGGNLVPCHCPACPPCSLMGGGGLSLTWTRARRWSPQWQPSGGPWWPWGAVSPPAAWGLRWPRPRAPCAAWSPAMILLHGSRGAGERHEPQGQDHGRRLRALQDSRTCQGAAQDAGQGLVHGQQRRGVDDFGPGLLLGPSGSPAASAATWGRTRCARASPCRASGSWSCQPRAPWPSASVRGWRVLGCPRSTRPPGLWCRRRPPTSGTRPSAASRSRASPER